MSATAEYLQNMIATIEASLSTYPGLDPLLNRLKLALAEPAGPGRAGIIMKACTQVPFPPSNTASYELYLILNNSIAEAYSLADQEATEQDTGIAPREETPSEGAQPGKTQLRIVPE